MTAIRNHEIAVEVAYAGNAEVVRIPVRMPAGSSIRAAIERSGILARCPEIDLDVNRVGVFSRFAGLEETLIAGGRIEIYRPVQVDPKAMRRERASKSQADRR
ncbi:MAG: RnfH family protein [Gammaproteobacteria bacterium]|jgi:putative ubiquitin-RnfH superfamily antitoxin RatB of RatAB toxin-antitoxin module|nr:MAG: RnfH family protein [Gammaproteobacteria bacterium]